MVRKDQEIAHECYHISLEMRREHITETNILGVHEIKVKCFDPILEVEIERLAP